MKKRLHLALGALVPVVVAGCSGGADGPGTGGVGNAPGAGGTASGGAATGGSGGISSGGVGTGGVEGDGGASGGWGGGGGLPLPVEGAEFVRCFPWGTLPPQMGPLLAATPSGSVLVLGPSAPPGLFPESPGLPFLLELDASGVVLQSFAIPDAPGPEIMTIAEDGTVYFAGQAGPGVIGAQPVPAVPSGYYLAKLSPTFEVLAVTAVESPSTQVNAMHVDLAGDLVVGTAIADFEAGSMKPAVTKFFGDP